MSAQGESRDYDEANLFRLEIDSIEVAAFESCSEFEQVSAVIMQREGGKKSAVSKKDGPRTETALTLVRGASSDTSLWDWYQQVKTQGSRAAERNCSIVQLNPDGSPRSYLNLHRAWPSSYKKGPWAADSEDSVKEEIKLEWHDDPPAEWQPA